MKHFFTAALLLFALAASAQNKMYVEYEADTLTNTDTLSYDLGFFKGDYAYAIHVAVDSVSGSTNANVFLQRTLSESSADWVTIDTVVVNGVTTNEIMTGTLPVGGHLRVWTNNGSSQVNAVRVYAGLIRRD